MREVTFSFPTQGINKRLPHGAQPELTTPSASNVRSDDTLQQRERGGSRPAFVKVGYTPQIAGGSYDINLLSSFRYVNTPGVTITEKVVAGANGEVWWGATDSGTGVTTLSKITGGAVPAGIIADDVLLMAAEFAGKLYIADWGTPVITGTDLSATSKGVAGSRVTKSAGAGFTSGIPPLVDVEKHALMIQTQGTPVQEIQRVTLSGTPASGTVSFSFGPRQQVVTPQVDPKYSMWAYQRRFSGYWGRRSKAIAVTDTAEAIGFQLCGLPGIGKGNCVVSLGGGTYGSGSDVLSGGTTMDVKFINDLEGIDVPMLSTYTNTLATSAPADITITYTETTKGGPGPITVMNVPIETVGASTLDLTYAIDIDDGASTVAYNVQRAPKVIDPDGSGDIIQWKAKPGHGFVPLGSKVLVNWRSRMVMVDSSSPHVVRMSRQGDPRDWQLTDDVQDLGRPIIFTTAEAGLLSEPVTGIVDWADSCLVVFTENSTWVCRGDPAMGGVLTKLDSNIGIVGPHAWCFLERHRMVFLSHDGLCLMQGQCGSPPISLSRERIPDDLLNESDDIVLEADVHGRGFYILRSATSLAKTHYWVDMKTTFKGDQFDVAFFEQTFPSTDFEPRIAHQRRGYSAATSWTLFGCRDGYIRHPDHRLAQDNSTYDSTTDADARDGTGFDSHVDLFAQIAEEGMEAKLMKLNASLASGSGDVDYEVYTGSSAERANNKTEPAFTGVWYGHETEGMQHTNYPMVTGTWIRLRLKNADCDRRWAMESVTGTVRTTSRSRKDKS